MQTPHPATTVRQTPHFDFLFGRNTHSNVKIPYFQVNMTFQDAATYLRLVNELPGAESMDWRIEELFQRDIDWWRVERKILPYLRQQEQPQFFNSLTIALLPYRNEAVQPFEVGEWRPPSLNNESQFSKISAFGPVQCGYWQEWTDISDDAARLGQMCWNTEEICGVAIDGQHRLAAIKELTGASHGQCTVPVILVVLDPELGYTGRTDRTGTVDTLRRLFIDLNKHAKKPSRAREILLDDRDPASICVRAIVGNQLQAGCDELSEDPPRLPLSLVDWHSEQAKFDTGSYLTTVLGLDWSVAKLIGIKPLEDMLGFESISSSIGAMKRQLEIDLSEADTRLEDCQRHEKPFSFLDEELDAMSEGFRTVWSASLIHLLTELLPYRQLIEKRRDLSTLTPEFANWCALKRRADDARGARTATQSLSEFESRLARRDENPVSIRDLSNATEELELLKRERELAFTVVFQRALILAFQQFAKITGPMLQDDGAGEAVNIDELLEAEEDQAVAPGSTDFKLDRASQLVSALNKVIATEPNFLHANCEFRSDGMTDYDRFWIGSLVQAEGPIDFAQAASKRASEFLFLIAVLWLYQTVKGVTSFDDLLVRARTAENGIDLKFSQCLGRLRDNEGSVARKILRARDEEITGEAAGREILSRVRWLWDALAAN